MTDLAERLVEHLLPPVPYRHWVFTVPRRIRYLMARDRNAIRAIYDIFIRSVFSYLKKVAKSLGLTAVLPGAVGFIQHFGSNLNLNVHVHAAVMDGVFVELGVEKQLTFAELPLIDPKDIERLLLRIVRWVLRYAQQREDDVFGQEDQGDDISLAQSQAQAVQAGLNFRRRDVADDNDHFCTDRQPLYCASIDGFSLYANSTVRAGDQDGLRRLIRYGARQAFATDRLALTQDGQVAYQLPRPWGPKQRTTLTLPPVAFLHRLAAIIPAPYLHLTRYSGIFAPNAHRRWELSAAGFRARAQARLRAPDSGATPGEDTSSAVDVLSVDLPQPMPKSIPWAELLARTFKVDVLQCHRCQGRLSIVAFITDLLVVKKILTHLGLGKTASIEPIIGSPQLEVLAEKTSPFASDDSSLTPARPVCRGPPTHEQH
jgi:hypothetical protein